MTLFFVGVVEMAIAASWTRFISRPNMVMNGLITYVNIFIWYYVIDQVINHLDGWQAIIPYAAGCAIGSMLGGTEPKRLRTLWRKFARKTGILKTRRSRSAVVTTKLRVPAEL